MRFSSICGSVLGSSLLLATLALAQQAPSAPAPLPPLAPPTAEQLYNVCDGTVQNLVRQVHRQEATLVQAQATIQERSATIADLTKSLTTAQEEIKRLAPRQDKAPAAGAGTN